MKHLLLALIALALILPSGVSVGQDVPCQELIDLIEWSNVITSGGMGSTNLEIWESIGGMAEIRNEAADLEPEPRCQPIQVALINYLADQEQVAASIIYAATEGMTGTQYMRAVDGLLESRDQNLLDLEEAVREALTN